MAVFGAPVAHGNDPERAARAALAIRDACRALGRELGRELGVHIGIASGQVVASGTGSARHLKTTVTGDSVNLASRLTDQAGERRDPHLGRGPAPVAGALRLHRGRRARDQGPDSAGHGLAPVDVRDEPAPRRPVFVGRRAELAQFEGRAAGLPETRLGPDHLPARRGRHRQDPPARGVPAEGRGAGLRLSQRAGARLRNGDRPGRDPLAGPQPARPAAESSDPAAAAALERMAADRRSTGGSTSTICSTCRSRPSCVALYDAMDNDAQPRQARDGRRAGHAGSTRAPRLLAIEDVHWADQATLDHLASLADTAAGCRAHPGHDLADRGRPARSRLARRRRRQPIVTIDLGPLRRARGERAGRGLSRGEQRVRQRCIERAAGNPLFLEQLLRHAEESAEAGVPGSMQSLVQARSTSSRRPTSRRCKRPRYSASASRWSAPAPDRRSALRLRRPGRASPGAPAGRRLPVRPRADPGRRLRHAAQGEAARAAPAGAAWFGARPDAARRAPRSGRGPGGAPAYLAAAASRRAEYRYEQALALVDRGLALAAGAAERFALTCLRGELLETSAPWRRRGAPTRPRSPPPRTTPSAAGPGSGSRR